MSYWEKLMQTSKNKPVRIIVIGGGISGLSAAHRLSELSAKSGLDTETTVLERSGRLGGVISSKVTDGLLIEGGPDSFITTKPWALDLCLRLGMESRLIQTSDESRRIFVARRDRLVPMPEGFSFAPTRLAPFVFSPLFSLRGKLRMALDLVLPRRKSKEDESVESFFTRRLGSEAFNLIVQPLVSGIYGASPENLSVRAALPQFAEMEEKHGSLIMAMRRAAQSRNGAKKKGNAARYNQFVSFREGMGELIDALASSLPEGDIQLNKPVKRIETAGNTWKILTNNNESIDANGVVIAVPTIYASGLVKGFDPLLGDYLSQIKYASSVVVNLLYKREDISHPLDGVGFVVPKIEGLPISACSFSSLKFTGRAPPETVLLRCFMGEDISKEVHDKDDSYLSGAVHNELSVLLGITSEPLFSMVKRNLQSMPQYAVGHLERIARINQRAERYPGMELAGNAYYGVGIPDCVRSGEEAAEKLFKHLERSSNRA
jgi:protoporphyrinogen/coproporphyrinogen III oxidase